MKYCPGAYHTVVSFANETVYCHTHIHHNDAVEYAKRNPLTTDSVFIICPIAEGETKAYKLVKKEVTRTVVEVDWEVERVQ